MGNEVTKYVDQAMFQAAPIDTKGPVVHLVSATPDPLGAIAAACRMYEGTPTYNLGDISDRERWHYWEQVQKTHLKAPLEFVDLHFFIEGVTRSFTHQMVRQRTAVFAQESMRFAVKNNMVDEMSYPPSVRSKADRELWDSTIQTIQDSYNALIGNGIPAEDARGLLPHQTLTRLNYKTNLRNLIEHAGNRLCTQAQFEWRHVFLGIVKAISEYEGFYTGRVDHATVDFDEEKIGPIDTFYQKYSAHEQWEHIAQSGVFKPVCFALGHCPFTAVFDRQCTIRSRVQEGKFDEIETTEWMADPTAGRRD